MRKNNLHISSMNDTNKVIDFAKAIQMNYDYISVKSIWDHKKNKPIAKGVYWKYKEGAFNYQDFKQRSKMTTSCYQNEYNYENAFKIIKNKPRHYYFDYLALDTNTFSVIDVDDDSLFKKHYEKLYIFLEDNCFKYKSRNSRLYHYILKIKDSTFNDKHSFKINKINVFDLLNGQSTWVRVHEKIIPPKNNVNQVVEISNEQLHQFLNKTIDETTEEIKLQKINTHLKLQRSTRIKAMVDNLEEIFTKLPDEYLNDANKWYSFTTFCKMFDKKELWDKMSQNSSKYDKQANENYWRSAKLTYTGVIPKILTACEFANPSFVMYKDEEDIMKLPFIKTIEINRKKLGPIKNESDQYNIDAIAIKKLKQKCVVIKSDTGTGKSTVSSDFLKEYNDNYISLVCRNSIGKDQNNKLPFDKNCSSTKTNKQSENVITTMESIQTKNMLDEDDDGGYSYYKDHILFIDEFHSFLDHIYTSDTIRNREAAMLTLLELMETCKKVICVDADINQVSLHFLKMVHGEENMVYVKNNHLHNKDVTYEFCNDYNTFIKRIQKCKKYNLCSDMNDELVEVTKDIGHKNIKLYTGKTDNGDIMDLDANNRNAFSPTITQGLDAQDRRPVFCYYTGTTISTNEMIQQICRTRNITHLTIYFKNKSFQTPKYVDLNDCYDYVKNVSAKSLLVLKGKKMSKERKMFLKTFACLKYLKDIDECNKFINLIRKLNKKGFQGESKNLNEKPIKKPKTSVKQKIKNAKETFDPKTDTNQQLLKKELKLTPEIFKKNMDLFYNQTKIDQHFAICQKFIYNLKNVETSQRQHGEYLIKYIETKRGKIHILEKFAENIDEQGTYLTFNKKTNYDQDLFTTYYSQIGQGKQLCTDKNYLTIYVKMCKSLFGKDIILSHKKKEMIDGKRKTVTYYKYNSDIIKRHKQIYDYRKLDIVHDSDDETDDEEVQDEQMYNKNCKYNIARKARKLLESLE